MLTKIKNKAKKLARGKKGVSQFVEMLIIIGVTLAVGGVVIGVVWNIVRNNTTTDTGNHITQPANPQNP